MVLVNDSRQGLSSALEPISQIVDASPRKDKRWC